MQSLVTVTGDAPVRRPNPRNATPSSMLGCEVALAALRAAGDRGIPARILLAMVMAIGECSEDAAYQQMRFYVRPDVAIWSPAGARRGRGTRITDQIWQINS